MVQEGALWPSVMITLGLCWCKVKLNWANIANDIVALLHFTAPENAYLYVE